ncbi:MAG: hypothetical protein RR202_05685 [Bacteroidales bacterium]
MKIHHIIFLLFLFASCSFNDEKEDQQAINSDLEKIKQDILPALKSKDSAVWYTITGVVDTVKHHVINLETWPEEAVGKYINDFWDHRAEVEPVPVGVSPAVAEFMLDTMRVRKFRTFIPEEDNSSWDMIYVGDFELLNIRYLNKKYRRLIYAKNESEPFHQYMLDEQPLWEGMYNSFKVLVDSVFLAPHDYMLREQDKLRLLVDMYETRLHSIAEAYLITADPNYCIAKNGVWVTRAQVDKKIAETIDCFKSENQREVIRRVHDNWSKWIDYRTDFLCFLRDKHLYDQNQVLLNNMIANYYFMIDQMKHNGLGKWKRKMKDDPSNPYKQW